MSEPKLISPLLDGFAIGAPMSSHDGVSCCPAIKEDSDKKYIVKIIAIPASQVQMDALLLAGAYKDPAGAMEYYRVVGEEVMKEAELLTTLSRLDGFLPYEGWQMEPITKRRLGYEVYLVSSYKHSLEKYVRRNPVTHLEAVNMGLDICAALAVCRQAGALYVDLKPSNIFISDKKEYRIGDLGFIRMDAMAYTALPDKYRSCYTPPELHDPMASMNLTVDTYAVGMILYQLYNDGQLPFRDKAPEEPLPAPVNADYELSSIIMKAIHPDPSQRWDDPQVMGRALVDYMQRNAVNDVPITPYTPLEIAAEPPAETAEAPQDAEPPVPAAAEDPAAAPVEGAAPAAPAPGSDEPQPSEADADSLQPHEMAEDLYRILSKADDLLAHNTPVGVVIPEIPEGPDPFAFAAEDSLEIDDSGIPLDPVMDTQEPEPEQKKTKPQKKFASTEGKRKVKKFLSNAAAIAIAAVIGFGLFWAYQNVYVKTIDTLTITGERNQLTVRVTSEVDDSLLSVECSDNYGNVVSQRLYNGSAIFTGLLPNTMYKVEVKIDGLHALKGQTSEIFSTDGTTSIVSFTAVTGPEDGSVVLNFTVDGIEPDRWTVLYGAEGEEEQHKTFAGHSVTIAGLSVGKTYTFTLDGGEELSLSGKGTITFMASRLILAQNLSITSSGSDNITVHWNAPGDVVVDSWDVRCYNSSGYEEQFTVTDTEVHFTGIDPSLSYTVEVTAAGMTQPARTSITANPINITALNVDESDPTALTVSWDHTGTAPAGGWLLMYTIDGDSAHTNVVKCDEPSAVIETRIPDAKYQFTIQAADSTSIFSNVHSYTAPAAEDFSANDLSASEITGYLLVTPDDKDWTYADVGNRAFTSEFASGDQISIVLHGDGTFYLPGTEMKLLYVVRDTHGNVLPELVAQETFLWRELWARGDHKYGELDLPKAPEAPGDYTVSIYFNNARAATLGFSITE